MREFNKVIGYESIKKELYRILDMMNNHDKYSALGVKTTRGLLFNGKPGLGKTLMAKCFIKASKRKTFTIRKDKPNEDFIKYIKSTFEKAKKETPCIVFLDDLDKFANEDEVHKNSEVFVTIQSCIDDLENKEVFVLATTNSIKNIPDSLLREGRIGKKFYFNYPKEEDVKAIVKYYLSKKKVSKDLNYEDIARLLGGRSCACLEKVINEAGANAAYEGKKEIEMNDIVKAFLDLMYFNTADINKNLSRYTRNIAVHEAGHAVVGDILDPNSINLVHINPNSISHINGFAFFHQGDDYFLDIKNMENMVITLLAGKAATELVYGKVDTGTSTDISKAYSLVKEMVTDYCAKGFNNYEERKCDLDHDEKQLIANELDRYYLMAKQIIIENRKFFDAIVDKLVKDKVVLYGEMQELKAKYAS